MKVLGENNSLQAELASLSSSAWPLFEKQTVENNVPVGQLAHSHLAFVELERIQLFPLALGAIFAALSMSSSSSNSGRKPQEVPLPVVSVALHPVTKLLVPTYSRSEHHWHSPDPSLEPVCVPFRSYSFFVSLISVQFLP